MKPESENENRHPSSASAPTHSATVAELVSVITEFNRAHDLDLKHKLPAGTPNPLLDALYVAATNAALSLQPLCAVEIKTALKAER